MQAQAWPGGRDSLTHDPALRPMSMLLVDTDVVVAALDVLAKEIVHAGRAYSAAGLSTVVTRQDVRGRGYGRLLVAAGHDAIAERGFDLGIFTCDRPLRDFYESAGWRWLPGTVLVGGTPSSPFPSDQTGFDKVTMADFFSEPAKRDRSAFLGTRVALYPGEIDKLW
ncbi:GNAT family N-acetyltransferase [Actinokineospora sp.]|uniref:GNAT family N-acetyltransferase n=1 Tax=Actinokineospora sp. TaxID=1872133 RepID=UPI003D6C0804